jgi:hypothetical protein
MALFPEWWAQTMGPLEEKARQQGLAHDRWGGYPYVKKHLREQEAAPMCSDCEQLSIW